MGLEEELALGREKLSARLDFEGSELHESEVAWFPVFARGRDFEGEYGVCAEVEL